MLNLGKKKFSGLFHGQTASKRTLLHGKQRFYGAVIITK
jgi:hypothetical protein